ncbi:Alpha/Beta hydrolase protein [Aspergillus coremiiformis]|uniref:Alpha/Beta hydrolase protein n=1 Tax=Aspergillus coremiiformis TaxID=138285 RepID=A0A5N6ZFA6_9EURO|nr:Alpha/Beta hydrolase protein [Aspergillus coremiiformis]
MVKRWAMQRAWHNHRKAILPRNRIARWTQPGCSQYYHSLSTNSNSVPCTADVRYHSKHKMRLCSFQQPRNFVTTAIPSVFVPPLIFFGLLISLWTWKCFWIVIMQDKLLYLSWLPPFARSEKISDYEAECRPVQWTEKRIRSLDGTKLTVCEGRITDQNRNGRTPTPKSNKRSVVVCYFQGNGGSTPLRLPLLSQVLRTIETSKSTPSSTSSSEKTDYTIVALSYRGYWTSSGRATQSGIELDAQAFLDWVSKTYVIPDIDLKVILWGHSLGAAIASTATATYLSRHGEQSSGNEMNIPCPVNIAGLVLEAPSSNIKDMLISLYPQKWLPYRYLWPFSWNHWSCTTAMEKLACWRDHGRNQHSKTSHEGMSEAPEFGDSHLSSVSFRSIPPILLLSAGDDEVIPPHVADGLESDAKRLRMDLERKDVSGALHTEAPLKMSGRATLVNFILKTSSPKRKIFS